VTKSAGFCFENAALKYAAERRSAPIERMGFVVKHPMSQIIRVAMFLHDWEMLFQI
jgi:hypothetical protein